MAITGSVELKVSTEAMLSQADEVEKKVNDMVLHFEEMKRYVDATLNHWIGDAGDLHRKLYQDQIENIDTMIKRLKEHPQDLRQMSEVYSAAETGNVAASEALPSDVIS